MKLIIDNNQKTNSDVVDVVMQGGKFKWVEHNQKFLSN
jgi:hypothetical protein